ncbi:MAG: cbb3-type cytochrome c oxidase subunit 3 [Rhodanobacter sp.]
MSSLSPIFGNLVGVFIVLMMVIFIGIWIWAWRKYHKRTFDRMAHLPMEDELRGTGGKNPVDTTVEVDTDAPMTTKEDHS